MNEQFSSETKKITVTETKTMKISIHITFYMEFGQLNKLCFNPKNQNTVLFSVPLQIFEHPVPS